MKNKSEKKKGFIKRTFGFFFDFRKWTDFDEIIDNAKLISESARDLCAVKSEEEDSEIQEQRILGIQNFEEMAEQFKLTEMEIQKRERFILYYLFVYLFSAVGLLIYSIYLMSHSGRLLAVLATTILTILLFLYAVREHLLYMQLKRRKLGCNFKEWLTFLLGGMKNEKLD